MLAAIATLAMLSTSIVVGVLVFGLFEERADAALRAAIRTSRRLPHLRAVARAERRGSARGRRSRRRRYAA